MILTTKEMIDILTLELIKAKADVDFETDPDKREYVEKLEAQLLEVLR